MIPKLGQVFVRCGVGFPRVLGVSITFGLIYYNITLLPVRLRVLGPFRCSKLKWQFLTSYLGRVNYDFRL